MAEGDVHWARADQVAQGWPQAFIETGEVRAVSGADFGEYFLSRNGTVCRVPSPVHAPQATDIPGISVAIKPNWADLATGRRMLRPVEGL